MQFRKELTSAIHESHIAFNSSIERIGRSITQLGENMCRSFEFLSQALIQSSPVPHNQNYFYQQIPQHPRSQGPYSRWLDEHVPQSDSRVDAQDSNNLNQTHERHTLIQNNVIHLVSTAFQFL